ncbi:MAG TPA: hypothetical protein VM096_07970, partial [Vicinamibacterales bacterium]|nr:hypothetical protein [Vicinamibacterales bacterium]
DNRSFSHNEENNVSAVNETLALSLLDSFERDLAVCQRVTLEKWRKRPIAHKTVEALASFVQDQV